MLGISPLSRHNALRMPLGHTTFLQCAGKGGSLLVWHPILANKEPQEDKEQACLDLLLVDQRNQSQNEDIPGERNPAAATPVHHSREPIGVPSYQDSGERWSWLGGT